MSEESKDNSVQSAIDAGMLIGTPREVNGVPFIVLPGHGGHAPKIVDLGHMLGAPSRTKRTVIAHSLTGFLGYWNRFVANPVPSNSAAAIYADMKKHLVTAIFDDDVLGTPGWRQHRMTYDCPKSPEWLTWSGANKVAQQQDVFAAFIEQNMPDVVEPAAADMLTIARELEATKTVSFGQSVRLENGQASLKYEEEIDGSTNKGAMKIPEVFKLAIPVFLGGPTYAVTCRLRYRIPTGQGKGLMMSFEIDRPHVIVEDAFKEVLTAIREGTGVDLIEATPEASRTE